MMKTRIVAWVAGLVTTMVLSVLLHRLMMGEQFAAVFERLDVTPSPVPGPVMYAIVVAIMVHLYPMRNQQGTPALNGYKFGAAIGLLFVTPLAMVFYAIGISMSTILADVLWHTFVEHALAGSVIGIVFDKGARPETLTN